MQLKNQRSGKKIVSDISFLTELLPVLSFEKTIVNIAHDIKELFYAGGRYHIETSPLVCCANQWTGFYMITASVMKELISATGFGVIYDYYKGTFIPLRKNITHQEHSGTDVFL